MRTKILVLGLVCLFVISLTAKEEVAFKSVLKDADFYPQYHTEMGQSMIGVGWWTLKFENGSIIRVYRNYKSKPVNDIWQVGKKYAVTKNRRYFQVEVIEEKKSPKSSESPQEGRSR